MTISNFTITAITPDEFGLFLGYLDDHLSDNGREGSGYFQPLPREASRMPQDRVEAFRVGLQIPVGEPGWRRLWVARTDHDQIAGHVDLRSHAEHFAAHRCLLGMGVDRHHRRHGLGQQLIVHAQHWALETNLLEWIDLKVLTVNEAAVRLYRRAGFTDIGEVEDMFHFDGQSFAYLSMARRVA